MPFSPGNPFRLNFNAFDGTGFTPTPGLGQLNSNEFRLQGFSDAGGGTYGGTLTAGDYARGTITGTADPTTVGVYAAVTGNVALGTSLVIQPTAAEFGAPAGTITLRLQYNGAAAAAGFEFDYDGVYRNNAGRSVSVSVSYAVQAADTEPTTYSAPVSSVGFQTPVETDPAGASAPWVQVALPTLSVPVTINPSDYVFIRYTIGDNGGVGSRDETGFDNITLSALSGTPQPAISIAPGAIAAPEGNVGSTAYTYTLTRSAAPTDASVQVTLTGGAGFDAADVTDVRVDGAVVAATPGSPFTVAFRGGATTAQVTVNVAGDTVLEADEGFTLTLSSPSTGNTLGTSIATGTVTNDDTGPVVNIYDIQGMGAASPLAGQLVTIEGIVTGDYQDGDGDTARNLDGFFVQQVSDGNATTSDGIFVFQADTAAKAVAVGDRVRVTGRVTEFARFATQRTAGLTETQIEVGNSDTGITVLQTAELTSEQVIATLAQDVTLPTTGVTTLNNGVRVANLEAFEGMLVRLPQTLALSEGFNLDRFGDVRATLGAQPFQFTQLNDPSVPGFQASQLDLASRTITIDDGVRVQNPNPITVFGVPLTNANAPQFGDTFSGLVGNVRFSDASSGATADNLTQGTSDSTQSYRILPSATPTVVDTAPRTPAPGRADGDLKLVGTNLLNFFTTLDNGSPNTGPNNSLNSRGANNAAELARQKERLYTALQQLDADLIVVNEIENNGFGPGSAIRTLVDEFNARPGSPGDLTFVDPGVTYLGGDAIKVSILYRTSKLQIAPGTTVQVLDDSKLTPDFLARSTIGRVFNGPDTSRAILVTTFQQVGSSETFTVAAVHNKSKSGNGTGVDADQGDGAGAWNNQRLLANEALDTFLRTNPTGSTDPDRILFGDFNSYAREASVQYLSNTAGFRNLVTSDIGPGATSYVFDGQKGTLDYSFSTQSLVPNIKQVAEWNVNSPELDALDYNTDFGKPADIFDPASPFRYSDHDPIVVNLLLDPSVQLARGGSVATVFNAFAAATGAAQAGDTVVVRKPVALGNVGAQTIGTDNLTVQAQAGFSAAFQLGAGVTRFDLTGLASNSVAGNALDNVVAKGVGATVIDGAAGSDTVVLAGTRADYSFTGPSSDLTVTDTAANRLQNIEFLTFTGNGETLATSAVCYLRSTGIMTPGGEVAIEDLRVGDLVVTLDGLQPVKWVGRQSFISRFVNGNPDLQPVRIAAGALGDGLPTRPLFVSLDHALLLDGLLVPAGQVLGGGIAPAPMPERLEYYNVELEQHGCVLAHGVWAESYADTGNRLGFHNHSEFAALYPDHVPTRDQFCARRTQFGDPALAAIRARLGCDADEATTAEPDLRLEVNGATVLPECVKAGTYRFRLPYAAKSVRLLSRSDVPARSGLGGTDHRRLGVAVSQVIAAGEMVDLAAPLFATGFHASEGGHRWTDGNGLLRLTLPRGAVLELTVTPLPGYRITAAQKHRSVA